MGDLTTQTRTDARGPETADHDDSEKKTLLGLSLSQLAGSALAAMTAAVAASFLGVAGTLIGAAFGSVVSTVAGAAYATSLKTAATRVRTTRTLVVRPGPDAVRGASQTDPARVPSGFGAEPVTLGRADLVATAGADGATTYRAAPPPPRPARGPRRSRREGLLEAGRRGRGRRVRPRARPAHGDRGAARPPGLRQRGLRDDDRQRRRRGACTDDPLAGRDPVGPRDRDGDAVRDAVRADGEPVGRRGRSVLVADRPGDRSDRRDAVGADHRADHRADHGADRSDDPGGFRQSRRSGSAGHPDPLIRNGSGE